MPQTKQITRALDVTTKLTLQLNKAREALRDLRPDRLVPIFDRMQPLVDTLTDILERLDARTASVEPTRRAEVGQKPIHNRRRKA